MDLSIYFCTTIRCCRHQLRAALALFVMLMGMTGSRAENTLTAEQAQHIDSIIHVGLITCQPSPNEVYSLYGHTAIHFVNTELGVDVAANWGVFSLAQEGFAFRFLMGTALYALDIQPYDSFCQYYAMHRRGIVEQPLNLSAEEKLRFAQALAENSMPQNRDYRYDFFYDNCSTRARDIIIRCIEGDVNYAEDDPNERPSFRYLTHQYNADHPWARFGNDILLGLKADSPISQEDAQFLPDRLMADFAKATKAADVGGQRMPLVSETRVVVPYFSRTSAEDFPLRPRDCFLLLLSLVIVVTGFELRMKRHLWLFDTILMLTAGICGVVLFAMIFSKHPTVSLNLQLLLLNPLPLLLVWRMVSRSRKHLPDRQYLLWLLLICLFFIGNLWQTYAEGMNLVGAALLVRNIARFSQHGWVCFACSTCQQTIGGAPTRFSLRRGWMVWICFLSTFCQAEDADLRPYGGVRFNEVMVSNIDMYLSPTYNFDSWVELYNPSDQPVQLDGLYVSNDMSNYHKWKFPSIQIQAHSFYVLWFSDSEPSAQSADFKLDPDGGRLILCTDDNYIVAQVVYPKAVARVSYARLTEDDEIWGSTGMPTPGCTNATSIFSQEQATPPMVDTGSKIFHEAFELRVDIPDGSILRYTTDGSTPTEDNGNTSLTGLFQIAETTLLRLRSFHDGKMPSDVVTRSFLYNGMPVNDDGLQLASLTLPVLSIIGDDDFFYDDMIGVMVSGQNGIPGNGTDENCNWNRDWQRPVSFVFHGSDEAFASDAIFEIAGGWSRREMPKPFKLKGDKVFGQGKTLDYRFFSSKPFIRNRTLQARNGGNDHESRIKTAAIQSIVEQSGLNIEKPCHLPVAHFINGAYKGVINLCEPTNKHYLYTNYGWDEDEIDFFEMPGRYEPEWKCGDGTVYNKLLELSKQAFDDSTYREVCRLLDVDEFLNYVALELFLENTDWVKSNLKGYRHRMGGRFRFIFYDLDMAFYSSSIMNWFYGKQERSKLVTMFFDLCQHPDFRKQFVDRFCIIGGSVFNPDKAFPVIAKEGDRVAHDLAAEGLSPNDMMAFLRGHIKSSRSRILSNLSQTSFVFADSAMASQLKLQCPTQGARVLMNGIDIPYATFDGPVFRPAILEAMAPAGWKFMGWQDNKTGAIIGNSVEYQLLEDDADLTPLFVQIHIATSPTGCLTPAVINEMSAHKQGCVNEHFKKSRWIELYNTTDEDIDLEGMFISDDPANPQKYQLFLHNHQQEDKDRFSSSVLPAHGFQIVWCDQLASEEMLHTPINLSSTGGVILLSAKDLSWTHVFTYPAHGNDTSIGRFPDGGTHVYEMDVTSIGKANVHTNYLSAIREEKIPTAMTSVEDKEPTILICTEKDILFRNPSIGNGNLDVDVYSINGVLVERGRLRMENGEGHLSLNQIPNGCYMVIVHCQDTVRTVYKICL